MYVLSLNNGLARCELICSARQKSNVEKKNHTQESKSTSKSVWSLSHPFSIFGLGLATFCTKFCEKSLASLFFSRFFLGTVADLSMTNLQNRFSLPLPRPVNLACWHFCASLSQSQTHKRFCGSCLSTFLLLIFMSVLLAAYFPAGISDFMNESQSPMLYILGYLDKFARRLCQLTSGSWRRIQDGSIDALKPLLQLRQ